MIEVRLAPDGARVARAETLVQQEIATSGEQPVAGGCVRGLGRILDSLDTVLRAYGSGDSGSSTILGSALSSNSGSREIARLVVIHAPLLGPAVPGPGPVTIAMPSVTLGGLGLRRLRRD